MFSLSLNKTFREKSNSYFLRRYLEFRLQLFMHHPSFWGHITMIFATSACLKTSRITSRQVPVYPKSNYDELAMINLVG